MKKNVTEDVLRKMVKEVVINIKKNKSLEDDLSKIIFKITKKADDNQQELSEKDLYRTNKYHTKLAAKAILTYFKKKAETKNLVNDEDK